MPKLPSGNHAFYAGIDPGFTGGIGLLNAKGTIVKAWDMPTYGDGKERNREIDLDGLRDVFRHIRRFPDCVVGVEWPTTRPGEGAERSARFGRGLGYLEAFAFLTGLRYFKVAPNLWKGRLGLDGKTVKGANQTAANLFDHYYPEHTALIRGPRGGIKDGRCDALLIAHFLRTRSVGGMQSVIEQYGKDSPQAAALVFARRGKKKMRMP